MRVDTVTGLVVNRLRDNAGSTLMGSPASGNGVHERLQGRQERFRVACAVISSAVLQRLAAKLRVTLLGRTVLV